MKRSLKFNHMSVAALAVIVGASMTVACSSSTDSTPVAATDGGSSGSSGSSGGTLTLYERLGGKAGLEAFVKNVVETKILADADLKTFFFNQVATPIPAGHPSAQQIEVCFARFVGAALQSDTYPGPAVPDASNTNTPNFTCRTMIDSHKNATVMQSQLHIGAGTFDKFIGVIAASLMPLVKPMPTKAGEISQAEFDALAAALNGQKTDVTTADAKAAAGPFPN